jgi:DNA oxidative demethylase
MSKKKKRLVYTETPPPGLFYIPGFLQPREESDLIAHISTEAFEPYNYHGFLAKREIVFYGSHGGYKGRDEEVSGPIPDWLQPLRSRCADLIALATDELEMALIAHYPIGAGIGWHRDAPQFGPTVIGVSFVSTAQMRFRRFIEDDEEMFRINLESGSAYIMSGPARSIWQHGMNPVNQLRYSITFRTVKDSSRSRRDDPRHVPEQIAKRLEALKIEHGINSSIAAAQPKQLKLF